MKKILIYIMPVICALVFFSCDKEQKLYNGDAQVAFEKKTYSFSVPSTATSISIPIQLIADGTQPAINTTISVNSATTCATAVSVPSTATIDAGRFTTTLTIGVTHANLNAGNANKLVLDLTSDVKVAASYKQVTITLTKAP